MNNNIEENTLPLEGTVSLSPQYANPSICFYDNNEPIMVFKKGKFIWKGEEVEDKFQIYERFNEWLTQAETNKSR